MSPQELNRNDDWQFFIEFADEVRQLIQQYPGIEHRNLDIDRTNAPLPRMDGFPHCSHTHYY
jgi:hypothetical protein